jgi:hypothetical protein
MCVELPYYLEAGAEVCRTMFIIFFSFLVRASSPSLIFLFDRETLLEGESEPMTWLLRCYERRSPALCLEMILIH